MKLSDRVSFKTFHHSANTDIQSNQVLRTPYHDNVDVPLNIQKMTSEFQVEKEIVTPSVTTQASISKAKLREEITSSVC